MVSSSAAELPPIAIPGQGALVSAEQIFDLANKPTVECHASTIAETPTGLVVAWFAGTSNTSGSSGSTPARVPGRTDKNRFCAAP